MAKYNLDEILSELGVGNQQNAPRKPHTLDKQKNALSPIPAAPGNQGLQRDPEATPAVDAPAPTPATAASPAPVAAATASASAGPVAKAPAPVPQSTEPTPMKPGVVHQPPEVLELATMLRQRGVGEDKIAVAEQIVRSSPNRRLSDALVEQGVDEALVQACVAEIAGIPFERINLEKGLDGGFDGKLLQRLTPEFCKAQMVIPLRTDGTRPVIGATHDNVFLVDDIKARLGVPSIKLVLVTAYDIRGAMDMIGEGAAEDKGEDLSSILEDVDETDVQVEKKQTEETDLEKAAGQNPVIRIVNHIIQTAVKEGASDIHIEPAEKKLKVRYRIDGELTEIINPPASMSAAITSRLKIMANLDIAERRLPQDGRIRCTVGGRRLDLRMSTLPCGHGEKTVMRILDSRSISVELHQLGFHEDQMTIWRKAIDAPHGINLVTGPTGSGKTTTLYASLRTLDKNSMNVCTVEDPIEYHLDGITQSQMHEKIGMTFAAALRALLRQDPDVIMLGEIRDMETAQVAVQAALTGHLVLSTLHTNDAPSSITRLVNIGLEPFLVGAAVNAVLAQRLIRKLCVHCKAEESPSEDMAEYMTMNGMNADKLWVAKGCDKCRRSGYSGRVGIYELLAVDDQLRDIIARNPNVAEFRRLCIERGMVTLRQDGMRKVANGITTISEVLRVTEGH
jgi:type IV pilus assembly protein PilB